MTADFFRATGRKASSILLLVVAACALTACTNGEFNSNPALDYALRKAGLTKDAPLPEAKPSVGRPLIVGYNDIRVAIPGVGKRGQSLYYVAPDGVEVAMNSGFVTRVTGLGIDLQGMYLPVDSPYLGDFIQAARDRAVADRVAEYYKKGRITRDSYKCALAYEEKADGKGLINEQCRRYFGDLGFRNRYWVEGDRIVCSTQWFHPDGDVLQFFETAAQATTIDLRKQGC
jgi:hypothetical protein